MTDQPLADLLAKVKELTEERARGVRRPEQDIAAYTLLPGLAEMVKLVQHIRPVVEATIVNGKQFGLRLDTLAADLLAKLEAKEKSDAD